VLTSGTGQIGPASSSRLAIIGYLSPVEFERKAELA
jgi:hypothetical protein